MAQIFLDRTDDGRFSVRVLTGLVGDKTQTFDSYGDAQRFALDNMRKRQGWIIDSCTMSAEQVAASKARRARTITPLEETSC